MTDLVTNDWFVFRALLLISNKDFCCFEYEGLLQSTILESVGCIWFNRSEAKDREIVARKYALFLSPLYYH